MQSHHFINTSTNTYIGHTSNHIRENEVNVTFYRLQEVTIRPYDDEFDDVAADFLFEEVSEPEEMTDDNSHFSP